jgi:hypothetical protein
LFDVLVPGNFLLPAVLSWARGYDGFVVVHLLCRAGHVVVGGGIRLGEYGKYIMQFGFGFGVEYFFSFTLTCYCNPFVIFFHSVLGCPRTPLIVFQLVALACIPAQFCKEFVAWFEHHFELITDQFEVVALVFLVPHALV